VDDEVLLGNDSVKQHWKGSDRCYAMAQYTALNNGVKDVFCVAGAAVIQQSDNSSENSAVQKSSECRTVTEHSSGNRTLRCQPVQY
jgi:hypothetical protein